MRLQQYFTEEKTLFGTYQEALDWINKTAKKYDSKNAFYASDEYKKVYPILTILHDAETNKWAKVAAKAMKKVDVKFGDKVKYDFVSPMMRVEKYSGTVINKNGIPYVKLDSGQKSMTGKKTIRWHKGWKK